MSKSKNPSVVGHEELVINSEESPLEGATESQRLEAVDIKSSFSVSWFLVILVLSTLGVSGVLAWFGWQQLELVKSTLKLHSSELRGLDSSTSAIQATEGLRQLLQSQLNGLSERVDRADNRNQLIIDRIESVAEKLSRQQVDTQTSYLLAEAEYLLKFSDQRLLIEKNPETAQILMRSAQVLLGQLEDGRLLPVREKLALDIQALDAVQTIDVLGIQAELLALGSLLADLTLPVQRLDRPEVLVAPQGSNNWLDILSEFVRIRKVDAPITPLVTALDSGRAREILRLNLEQIKVALIREDQALFDASVTQAARLANHFFSVNEGAGLILIRGLESIKGRPIVRVIPNASTGLRALREYRKALTRDRVATSEANQ